MYNGFQTDLLYPLYLDKSIADPRGDSIDSTALTTAGLIEDGTLKQIKKQAP